MAHFVGQNTYPVISILACTIKGIVKKKAEFTAQPRASYKYLTKILTKARAKAATYVTPAPVLSNLECKNMLPHQGTEGQYVFPNPMPKPIGTLHPGALQ